MSSNGLRVPTLPRPLSHPHQHQTVDFGAMISARQHPLLIALTTKTVREVLYTLREPFPSFFPLFSHSPFFDIVTMTGNISLQSVTSKDPTQVSQAYPKRPPYPPPSPSPHSHRRKPENKRGRRKNASVRRRQMLN